MLDQVLPVFGIIPDADLNLMMPNQTLAGLTALAVDAIDKYLQHEKPDLVMVQGDTTTVFCAALAALYQRIPVAHVEAGLRTGDMNSPWPEEANRVLTTRLTALHFAPTQFARQNLLREGVPSEAVFVTGNTVIDALFIALEKVHVQQPVVPGLPVELLANGCPVVLITGHRRESFGDGFENICNAIAELGRRFPSVHFVYPVHLNPNVREPVQRILHAGCVNNNVHLLEPLSYLPFVGMMERSTFILTDSGGVQEEAPSLGKPVLVMRNTTERPEAVTAGIVKLVGTEYETIVSQSALLLIDQAAYMQMSRAHNPYGDGHAASRIVGHCMTFLKETGG
jgi:UDP-N-acetylglucosamine 2-epimerase (non-hydrolysing)